MLTIDGDTVTYQTGNTLFVWKGGMYIDVHFLFQNTADDVINISDMDGHKKFLPGDMVSFVMTCENYMSGV